MAMVEIEEGSQNSEQLLEEDGGDLEFDSNDLEIEGDGLGIEENDLEIEDNSLEIEEKILEIEGRDLPEGNDLEDNCEHLFNIEYHVLENNRDDDTVEDVQNGDSQGKDYLPPVVGMEFESYDDAYNYYNCYAKDLGFAIRVKSSWTKRNSKEKRGAVLCCNCEGFKTSKEAHSRRKETRTGCLAMLRLRLVESNRWRVDEVKLEHNHLFDPERAQNSKSHKKMDAGAKRKVEPTVDVEVRTIKLYRTAVIDPLGYGSTNSNEGESSQHVDRSKRLKLKKGDAQIIYNYFCRVQLTNPNFFYLMDLNDEGFLRNVFWIDSRSRAAYGYFGDVVIFDTTCLSNKYEIPLFAFVGVNQHGQSILLGCGLLADETFETYLWLFRAWLTCMLGRPPQTIITDQCKAMQSAITEVFPRAHHRLCLSRVVHRILDNLRMRQDYEAFQQMLNVTIHDSLKLHEFEMAWEDMIQHFGIADTEWLRTCYEDRERWAPVYSKDTCFAGMSTFLKDESSSPFFNGYVNQQTTLKEFFDMYELVLLKKNQKEALDDFDSRNSSPMLRTSSFYELQLSKVYTNEIFRRFQDEVVMMSSCFSITQIHASGPLVTYMIKERQGEENLRDIKNFEVMYDKRGAEVRCICSCFNFKGYLCRHALCILNYNGVEEIPSPYILARWRKDFKRLYAPVSGSNNVDIGNPVQWFDHLYRRAMQVVEEGMISQDRYMVAWQAFKESLNKMDEEAAAAAAGWCSEEQVVNGELNKKQKEVDDGHNGEVEERKEFVAPAVGMEFESYDDAYNYYNCYAKEVGFRVRVKNSWFKRNSREKYGAVLCCSSQGFKRIKDVNRLRNETRTGCPAMIRMRLVDSKRWRVLEVMLEHNHSLGAKMFKPTFKKMSAANKRKSHSSSDAEVRTIKLYRALVIDSGVNGNSSLNARDVANFSELPNQLNLKRGDAQAIYNYFCRMQLTNPNFFYLMDLNDEGHLRNVFWIDARSRASCGYFGDVIYIDNTYLSSKFEIPLVAFVGMNHHSQSVLLGCGLLAGETTESYIWLFKAWLTSLVGCTPQTIITDRCRTLQSAIAEAFPRAHHRFGLSHIMKRVPEKLGGLRNYDAIKKALMKAVYETMKVIEFEAAWGFMVQRFGVGNHEWLRSLYEDRVRWAPVYLKDTVFAGMSATQPGETLNPFFERYVHKQTPLKEFLDKYELALQKKHKEATIADTESRSSGPDLKTRCSFELQLSKLYTKEIFNKFQFEVEEMYSCFSTTQIHVDGPIIIFLVKERVLGESNRREVRDYEVMYNRSAGEVRCICSCFNFCGYLCRHALCVLNFNGVEEIPCKYILSRWKKDYKRLYIPEHSSNDVGSTDHLQWFNQLYRSALQVVEEGVISLEHYSVALEAFEESLNRVHEVEEKQA